MSQTKYPGDWRYSNMELRQRVLSILLRKYSMEHPTRAMYECANEWIEKGNVRSDGVVKYFEAYYSGV